MPAKRTAFSVDEKRALRAHHTANRELSQRDLCQWFEVSFGRPIRQATVSEVLSSRYCHLDEASSIQGSSKRQRLQAYPDLERILAAWILREEDKLILTRDIIRAKALSYWHQLPQYQGVAPPIFSDGWLSNFKARHGITSRRRHGEARSVDEGVMAAGLVRLQSGGDIGTSSR